jgi:beta-galactosidase
MNRLSFLCFLLSVLPLSNQAQSQFKSFEIRDGNFHLNGNPVKIYSGEMHFARIPHEYWKHRLMMLKAMGLNSVATYVFWNYHEVSPGVWDYKTGNRNIRKFIQLAGELGLMVILRPGPYACAEWEFGGYPWWLQKGKNLIIRSNNKAFLEACNNYISRLLAEVKDLQITHGGPVVMFQAENEFGSYVVQRKDIPIEDHRAYSHAIKEQLLKAGVTVPLFTSDGSTLFKGGSIEGALPTCNGEDDVNKIREVVNEYHGGKGPYMVAEFYPGWLDHWAEPFPKVSTDYVVKQTTTYLNNDVSFNFYMVHGGTNFGFTTGANYNKEHDIQPDMTSYDYDAPISEAGWATEKYRAIRELLSKRVPYQVPDIPAAPPVITIPKIELKQAYSLDALIKKNQPTVFDRPLTFEELNQGNGYVLYSRRFEEGVSGILEVKGLRDYAVIYVNGKQIGLLNRYFKNYSTRIEIPAQGLLEIFVENMGRINYGAEIIHNLKGIISPVYVNEKEITGNWTMHKFPFDSHPKLKKPTKKSDSERPKFLRGTFSLKTTGDTFLDMREWGKGIVYVNGHHMGRYWSIGPQQTLYVPGVWLKKGKNEILIFEQLLKNPPKQVTSIATPILEDLRL